MWLSSLEQYDVMWGEKVVIAFLQHSGVVIILNKPGFLSKQHFKRV